MLPRLSKLSIYCSDLYEIGKRGEEGIEVRQMAMVE